ncbi:MAG: ParB N-terminal domain-containing protein [Proteobacteria bacterium]|nr:ParB N-terminal domain-containing protein [Pseudomonadota bacterium]MCL2590573.1 ParB N-terminal domain-containing protein [Betaproteobacteria bacterium]
MANLTVDEIAARLNLVPSAPRPEVTTLSAPLADQAMRLNVRDIRAFEHNPRRVKSPIYEELKESIRQRGLEQPLVVTRRPHEDHYIVARGGNTRLQILKELQQECQDGRFEQIDCLYTPWVNEARTLSSHLLENEARSSLLFIEKALAIQKLQSLYEESNNHPMTLDSLALRLKEDGCAQDKGALSRMRDAIRILLPAIPNLLFEGMGRQRIGKLVTFHNECERCWDEFAPTANPTIDFAEFFREELAEFDGYPLAEFSQNVVEDTIIGKMAPILGRVYADIEEMVRAEENLIHLRTHFLNTPAGKFVEIPLPPPPPLPATAAVAPNPIPAIPALPARKGSVPAHPATTKRVDSIKTMLREQVGDDLSLQQDGLDPYSEIETEVEAEPSAGGLEQREENARSLRKKIAQLAQETAQAVEPEIRINETDDGTGYAVRVAPKEKLKNWTTTACMTMWLLRDLSGAADPRPLAHLGGLLCGVPQAVPRLEDVAFSKLIDLIHQIRLLMDTVSAPLQDTASYADSYHDRKACDDDEPTNAE